MPKIAVVAGGRSLERDFSLRSGHHVAAALRHDGHDVIETDVDERLTEVLAHVDAAFIALHGKDGEDGTIQSVLEAIGVPYTGSGPFVCQKCFDKPLAKDLLSAQGFLVPAGHVISSDALTQMGAGAALRKAADGIGYPLVVKPPAQGSALGLVVVEDPEGLQAAVMSCLNYGDRVMLETYVRGIEVAVSVVGEQLSALPPVEISTLSGLFDFHARATPGGYDSICPAQSLNSEQLTGVCEVAIGAASLLGVRDFARVDMIVEASRVNVLEVNPCPGLTETSLLPVALACDGTSFECFVNQITNLALARA